MSVANTYIQQIKFNGKNYSKGSVVDLKESFKIICQDFPFKKNPKSKDLPSRDWYDEDGLDVYIPDTLPIKHYDFDVVFLYVGTKENIRADISKFIDFIYGRIKGNNGDSVKSSRLAVYNEYVGMGRKDIVVSEVEKVCDSQDISFEEVAGIETPEGEADETADADEVVATKEDVADALQGVIDAVEKVADANDIELPEEEDDEDGDASDDEDGEQYDEGCDCGKPDCPECNPDGVQGECGGQACECGDKVMESRRRRAKLVREAIARRVRARKIRESRERRAKVRKVIESIRRRRAAKKVLESIRRRRAAKKVMESRKPAFKKIRAKRVMESRRLRARRARMAK